MVGAAAVCPATASATASAGAGAAGHGADGCGGTAAAIGPFLTLTDCRCQK